MMGDIARTASDEATLAVNAVGSAPSSGSTSSTASISLRQFARTALGAAASLTPLADPSKTAKVCQRPAVGEVPLSVVTRCLRTGRLDVERSDVALEARVAQLVCELEEARAQQAEFATSKTRLQSELEEARGQRAELRAIRGLSQ
jgi:type II secretory pathway component HofQ